MNSRTLRNPAHNRLRQRHTGTSTTAAHNTIIQANDVYQVAPDVSGQVCVRQFSPQEIIQRNWSRVGSAQLIRADGSAAKCFIKQYIDRNGTRHHEHLEYEYDGARLATEILSDLVTVPTLHFKDERRLINVFEHIDLITVDELLRSDEARFWQYYPLLLEKLSDVLQALMDAPRNVDTTGLQSKRRNYPSQGIAINFKGFEIRNMGYQLPLEDLGSNTELPPVVMFDFVRPYLAPIEEAAAKLLVSIGQLNWGKPLSRFIKGPDTELLDMAFHYIGHWTNSAAMEAELKIQQGFRFNTIKGANRSESEFKRIGLNLVGRNYLRKLERWALLRYS